jgi:hypothetical protein
MPGRHVAAPARSARVARRPSVRWLVALCIGAAIAATALGLSSTSAGAAGDPVKASFGVTGVATSNCPVSVGGTDVYVRPGQELDVKTSLVGLYVLQGLLGNTKVDLNDVVGQIASFDGALVIDPGAKNPTRLDITNKVQKVTGLTAGNHAWRWSVDKVKLLGLLPLPLYIENNLVKAGAKLTWTGTIHVTSNAADCGVAVQLPSVSASASVSGLPPIGVGIPGVKVSVPVTVPTSLPTLGNPGGSNGGSHGGHGHHSAPPPAGGDNPIPVPAKVVPVGDSGGLIGSRIDFGGAPGGAIGGSAPIPGGAGPTRAPSSAPAAELPEQNSAGKHKTIDLAASRPDSTGEVWVVLAIVAVIALAFVAATYARLYLLKRGS